MMDIAANELTSTACNHDLESAQRLPLVSKWFPAG